VASQPTRPIGLQTTLTPAQEAVAVRWRKTLLVSLDDPSGCELRSFLNPNASRSGLGPLLASHGVGEPALPEGQRIKAEANSAF